MALRAPTGETRGPDTKVCGPQWDPVRKEAGEVLGENGQLSRAGSIWVLFRWVSLLLKLKVLELTRCQRPAL